MTTNTPVLPHKNTTATYADKALTLTATVWFSVATFGLWFFGIYILLFYGKATFSGHPEAWNKVLATGYVEGDWKGNLVVGMHVLLAAILVIGGPLQFIPTVRRHFPVFHRWLGRTYVATAMLGSVTGAIMLWTRGAVGDTVQHVTNTVQVIYIAVFGLLSVRYAKARQFDQHRRWATRLFMVTNGVWFFRVGLMCWILVNGGPAGFDPKTFAGPFLTFLSVFTYAIPLSLMVLELYFYAQRKQDSFVRFVTSAIVAVCTLIMGIGILGAAMGMWFPRL